MILSEYYLQITDLVYWFLALLVQSITFFSPLILKNGVKQTAYCKSQGWLILSVVSGTSNEIIKLGPVKIWDILSNGNIVKKDQTIRPDSGLYGVTVS